MLLAAGPAFAGAPENLPNPTETMSAGLQAEAPAGLAEGECPPEGRLPFADPPAQREFRMVWGILSASGDVGQRMAPNGVVYRPIYDMGTNLNIWLWPAQGLYIYSDSLFWMGTTQEGLNFTKRELDIEVGLAWNYYGRLEGRIFGYADSNMNRGINLTDPSGYSDGFGVENRFYLSSIYSALGTSDFDQARATFLSIGYYPTKVMIGGDGQQFKPSLFARAYLTWDVLKECGYLFADVLFIAEKSLTAKLLETDTGIALRPFHQVPRLEFRAGCRDFWDIDVGNARPVGYVSVRYIF
jgi:hypothetical protein